MVKMKNLIKFICKLFSIGMNVLDFDKEFIWKLVMTCTIVQHKNPFEIDISSSYQTKKKKAQFYGMGRTMRWKESSWNGICWVLWITRGEFFVFAFQFQMRFLSFSSISFHPPASRSAVPHWKWPTFTTNCQKKPIANKLEHIRENIQAIPNPPDRGSLELKFSSKNVICLRLWTAYGLWPNICRNRKIKSFISFDWSLNSFRWLHLWFALPLMNVESHATWNRVEMLIFECISFNEYWITE